MLVLIKRSRTRRGTKPFRPGFFCASRTHVTVPSSCGFSRDVAAQFAGLLTKDEIMKRKAWSLRAWVLAAPISSTFCCIGPAGAQSEEVSGGEKIFMQNNCFVCHGQQGFGGIGPAFRNDPFLLLTEYVACQILLGRGVMPPF